MSEPVKVVHYLNQFFGGIGGEDKAYEPVQLKQGVVGPGRALQAALGDRATIVASIVAGDNYFTEETQAALQAAGALLDQLQPDVLIAGPAFDAGRFGLACAEMCRLAQARGIKAVTGMHPDNAGILTYRQEVLAVSTGTDTTQMTQILNKMAGLAMKLVRGEELGPAQVEGYVPRGFRREVKHQQYGYERAVDMLVARLTGKPFVSEMMLTGYDNIRPAPPLKDMKDAVIGLVSSGGLVPRGNRDRLVGSKAEQFFRYDISEVDSLSVDTWESVHGGFGTLILNTKDPNYAMPLSTVRHLQREGAIKGIYPQFFTTTGNGTAVSAARRMGSEIATELKAHQVDGVLLVAT
jgi:betaine reductase